MSENTNVKVLGALPWVVGGAGALALAGWLLQGARVLPLREPGSDKPVAAGVAAGNPVLGAKLIAGPGQAADWPGEWSGFRGPNRNGIAPGQAPLARVWAAGQPKQLWAIEVGEGYAGPTISRGRVYLMDYDQQARQDALRCLSLADGREIWRFTYPVRVKRDHGMSRTIPVILEKALVTIGPKCHVSCLEPLSGKLLWTLDLAADFDTVVPPWYTGQCPLVDENRLILAPGGKDALLMAVDMATGKVLWRTPNPKGWKMTHSSVMRMDLAGEPNYVYSASHGVVGVSARDGKLLWDTTEWKISIANVPSPVQLGEGRLFFSGGYNAGSCLLQVSVDRGQWSVKTQYRLLPEVFGATQHTPILHREHLFGVRPDGQFVCLNQAGKVVWASGQKVTFGLGPFLLANDLFYVLSENGLLSLVEATPEKFNLLAQAQVLHGHEAWGPMALAGTKLVVRDFNHLACLEVGDAKP